MHAVPFFSRPQYSSIHSRAVAHLARSSLSIITKRKERDCVQSTGGVNVLLLNVNLCERPELLCCSVLVWSAGALPSRPSGAPT